MKKMILLLALCFGLASCNKEAAPPLTKQEIKHLVDSITIARMKEQDEMARKDLGRRIKIEVKVKADSIAALGKAKADSILNAISAIRPKDTLTK